MYFETFVLILIIELVHLEVLQTPAEALTDRGRDLRIIGGNRGLTEADKFLRL